MMFSLYRRWTLRHIARRGLTAAQRDVLSEHVPAYRRLPAGLRQRHEQAVAMMLARCHWEGCEGLVLDDAMRTRIAGHAAVMLLGLQDYYFETVSVILVFPDDIHREDDDGVGLNVGEAWHNGAVVLSWPEVEAIGEPGDPQNVVIHEFAHHLDGLDGEMGGSIPFNNREDQTRWDQVAGDTFAQLVDDVQSGRPTVLDPYGATNFAEFFAVGSEAFFEQPHRLQQAHGDLYELLQRFYHCDPRRWH